MRKHHNKLFYGKYRYKISFDFKWAPILYPTTDEHLQSFIDGKQTDTKYLNTEIWKVTSNVVALAKFIKDNRTRMKFRLQQNKAMFYTDKKLIICRDNKLSCFLTHSLSIFINNII